MIMGYRVGILGGGQLARMLVLEGQRMGLEMHILCPSSEEPAAQVTAYYSKGNPNNLNDLISFAKKVDILTLESEFFPGTLLDQVVADCQVPIFPSPTCVSQLQDRLPQKELLSQLKVPTAPFTKICGVDDLKKAMQKYSKFVLKKRQGGYDGNGTFVIDSHDTKLRRLAENKIAEEPDGFIAEEFIPFKKEMAVILARNTRGDAVHFPLVETKQSQHRCDWVYGPVDHSKRMSMLKKLFGLLNAIDYVGTIGFELFDTGKDLLVNEIAPRVHNSGHYSMDALSEDQFSLHLKAILGLPLNKPLLRSKKFVMVNLVGNSNQLPEFPQHLSGQIHWYGKKQNRQGRKMGHVNYLGLGKNLLKKALIERSKIKGL